MIRKRIHWFVSLINAHNLAVACNSRHAIHQRSILLRFLSSKIGNHFCEIWKSRGPPPVTSEWVGPGADLFSPRILFFRLGLPQRRFRFGSIGGFGSFVRRFASLSFSLSFVVGTEITTRCLTSSTWLSVSACQAALGWVHTPSVEVPRDNEREKVAETAGARIKYGLLLTGSRRMAGRWME